jgi:hypothetical protein
MQLRLVTAVTVLTMSSRTVVAGAVDLKTLIMPGNVIEGHADIESDCENCHVAFSREKQRPLCEACHKDVASDVRNRTGYHGRDNDAYIEECASCHTEHAGPDADIVGLDARLFNHQLTDFDLIGTHREASCEDCHENGAKHREAPSLCFDCHANDDDHHGAFDEACGSCHVETGWSEVEFDHGAETGYTLSGGHLDADCASCHVEPGYRNTPTECYACHRTEDAHDGLNGTDCAFCHVSRSWSETVFDHATGTTFPLTGAHGDIACADCHIADKFADKLETQCIACHKSDDEHRGLNGPVCEDCHSTTGWPEALFKHDVDTGFPLLGRHAETSCADCHTAPVHEVSLKTDCYACHREHDAHETQLGIDCGQCHNESGWTEQVLFDHGLTDFPLIGSHADTVCKDCHETLRFNDAPEQCIDCHRDADIHEKRLGTNCGACHTPTAWSLWEFDHNQQTGFDLDGAHIDLQCEACHTRPMIGVIELSKTCSGCHRGDDIHEGSFGNDCQRCHTTRDFQSVERTER